MGGIGGEAVSGGTEGDVSSGEWRECRLSEGENLKEGARRQG